MPKIQYQDVAFKPATRRLIDQANTIIAEYTAQGYDLTLRQLYYQFVARDLIRNKQSEYKRLGSIINDARLAGLIDWDHITDRTRNLKSLSTWENPEEIIDACASSFRLDLWAGQAVRIEVWIEKEALAGVFERVCNELRVPFFSCRGYTSQSEMWAAAQRLKRYRRQNQEPIVLHFGDHDPSGIDMSRDIRDRLALFMGRACRVERLALNMDQIEEHEPPPNPAKTTDSRYQGYIAEYGEESWELDALEPDILAGLVRDFVEAERDAEAWTDAEADEARQKELLEKVSANWDEVVARLEA